jgi:hypothetical protein
MVLMGTFIMLSSARSRFISDEAVIKTLTNDTKLPGPMKPRLCDMLQLPPNSVIENLSVVLTKGVGGTQCRPYVITLKGGEKVFLKLSPLVKKALTEQKRADVNIQEVLGKSNTQPFVCMFPASGAIGVENETRNELLFFPYVPGDNLFITTTTRNKDKESAIMQYAAIGKCLAQMHIHCMNQTGTYEQFKESCALTKVLVHDDWQATNIMITPENNAIIVDTEGTVLSNNKPYRNLAESWELSGNDPVLMASLVDTYLNEFSPELRERTRHNLYAALKQHGVDLVSIFENKQKPGL